jgi:hypothetical protein
MGKVQKSCKSHPLIDKEHYKIGDGGAADNIEWRICRHCGESELWEDVALRESMRIITDVR